MAADLTKTVYALEYAYRGWGVFPLKPYSKQPMTANGFKDATTNGDRISAFWTANPAANIGLATGQQSGFWVLDIDPHNGGWEGLDELGWRFGSPGYIEGCSTYVVETQSGGLHFYYTWPTDMAFTRIIGRLAKGVDVLGNGGYVVAPPSETRTGRYTRSGQELRPAPEALLAAIKALSEPRVMTPTTGEIRGPHAGGTGGLMAWLEQVPPGQQDDALAWVARALRDEGVTAPVAAEMIWDVIRSWPCSKGPWTEADVRRHINSAYK